MPEPATDHEPLQLIYLCADVSASTRGLPQPPMRWVEALQAELGRSRSARSIRIAVLGFAAGVSVLSRIGSAADPASLNLQAAASAVPWGDTRLGELFRALRREIRFDVSQLTNDVFSVRRPSVCLVTDGRATDDWTAAHRHLVEGDDDGEDGFRWPPSIVVVAVGNHDRRAVAAMAAPRMRRQVLHADEPEALPTAARLLTHGPMSVVAVPGAGIRPPTELDEWV